MYRNFTEFNKGYNWVSDYYHDFTSSITWMGPPDVRRAWDIYKQAHNQQLGLLVMGRTTIDKRIGNRAAMPADFGNAFDALDHANLGLITHSDEAAQASRLGKSTKTTGGMVMHFFDEINSAWRNNKSGYHFLYNDAWLLGGAHGLCEFHMLSPRWLSNLWDTQYGRLTATGREALFLKSAGYEVERVGAAGTNDVFVCRNVEKAKKSSFQSLAAALRSKSIEFQAKKLSIDLTR